MAYVMLIFMAHGFYGPGPIEYAGQKACENAKIEIDRARPTGVERVLCLPKSAPLSK
jgi:hypothetical protein